MKKLLATIAIVGLAASFAQAQIELNLDGGEFTIKNIGGDTEGLLGLDVKSADGGLVAPEGGGPLFAFTLPSTVNAVSLGNLGTTYDLAAGATAKTGVQYTGTSSILQPGTNFAGSSTGGQGGVTGVAFPIPEPASGLMAAFALMGLLGFRRRR